ncbi:TonB-dependent receptor [Reinekea blandensis]|uniref:Outer membrane cobalamin receptor protein n=1 Tax=Reinekea blandensis MED297 TaxID=314283 RepID=A4B9Q3_9GAMM|nr:TonB-dependent receptor [Reinekea blandensis]EAR11354.1 Outer membrane cobalamin receptor protein [Reinekea sp. MED297] [Reinekea blandensis MED297]
MSLFFRRTLGPATVVLVCLHSALAETELETVYSEVIPASATLPEFSVTQVQILTPDQFSDTAVSVADVIDQVPSVQVQQTGELGSLQSVTVRGAPSQQTQIYIDGVLQSSVGGEGNYLQQLSLTDIERIEVYPSSTPMQFNQATPGGAINIVRKRQHQTGLTLKAESGSFGRWGGQINARGRWLQTDMSAFLQGIRSDNDFTYVYDGGGTYGTDETELTRKNAGYHSVQGGLSLRRQGDNQSLNGNLEAFQNRKELPRTNNRDDGNAYYADRGVRLSLAYDLNQWVQNLDSSVRYQYLTEQGHLYDPDNQVGIQRNDSQDTLQSHLIQYHHLVSAGSVMLTGSQSLTWDQFSLEDEINGTTLDADAIQLSSSLGGEWFMGNNWTAIVTGRTLWIQNQQDGNRTDDSDWGLQAGLRHPLGPVELQWNIQRSHRQPNLLERYGAKGTFVGSPALESEQSVAADLSVTYKSPQLYAHGSAFIRQTDNAIAATYDSQGVGRYVNVANALYRGIEWQSQWRLKPVRLDVSGTLQTGIIDSGSASYDDGNQVPGYYPLSNDSRLSWQLTPKLMLYQRYLFETGLFYDRYNSSQPPTKHQWDAGVKWQNPRLSMSMDITNLLNRAHLDYSRKPLPGRAILFTIQITTGADS